MRHAYYSFLPTFYELERRKQGYLEWEGLATGQYWIRGLLVHCDFVGFGVVLDRNLSRHAYIATVVTIFHIHDILRNIIILNLLLCLVFLDRSLTSSSWTNIHKVIEVAQLLYSMITAAFSASFTSCPPILTSPRVGSYKRCNKAAIVAPEVPMKATHSPRAMWRLIDLRMGVGKVEMGSWIQRLRMRWNQRGKGRMTL